jgi:hypothetical protein
VPPMIEPMISATSTPRRLETMDTMMTTLREDFL